MFYKLQYIIIPPVITKIKVRVRSHPVVGVHDDVHLEHLPACERVDDVPVNVGSAIPVAAFIGVLL